MKWSLSNNTKQCILQLGVDYDNKNTCWKVIQQYLLSDITNNKQSLYP